MRVLERLMDTSHSCAKKENESKKYRYSRVTGDRTHSILFVGLLVGWWVPWSTTFDRHPRPTGGGRNSNRGTRCMLINGPWCVRRRIATAAARSTASNHTRVRETVCSIAILRWLLVVYVLSIGASAWVSSSSSFRSRLIELYLCVCARVCVSSYPTYVYRSQLTKKNDARQLVSLSHSYHDY